MSTDRLQPKRPQVLAERAFHAVERFLHIEAVSGVVLLLAAVVALAWANSSWSDSYHALWHLPAGVNLGDFRFERPLHFWVNDVLMTVFFLVVGMEIRSEIHSGSLADLRSAALPLAAAVGGVVVPALIYTVVNRGGAVHGWAVPTATDIAFAVGVLALFGRSIPSNVRIFLLALAIIDDIAAVLIIAFFYSDGLVWAGVGVAGCGILLVLALQALGIGTAYAYVIPAIVVWAGLLQLGIHPTLAGVVLGLMTPVHSTPSREAPLRVAERAVQDIGAGVADGARYKGIARPVGQLARAQREILPPVVRVQMALHPWVAYGVMPLFALANAGVGFGGVDPGNAGSMAVMAGIVLGLVVGKPVGIVLASLVVVKLGWCRLPDGVSWGGVILVGLLAGIGFTMSIFIAMLAFSDEALLTAAKLGVLLASLSSALLGLVWALVLLRRRKPAMA